MTKITTLHPGEHFMFKNFEWVCLDPNHPDGGVLAIMAEQWAKALKTDCKPNTNTYLSTILFVTTFIWHGETTIWTYGSVRNIYQTL
jgi:hypothetical protein